jgi:hypothetical protein
MLLAREEHMSYWRSRLLTLGFLLALAAPGLAQDKCTLKAVLAGTPATMQHCAVAFYDSENSVTLYFSDSPFSSKEIKEFEESSQMPENDAAGKRRSMIHFAFCPGGGKTAPNPAAVKLVEMSIDVASSPFLGWQNTFELQIDKDIVKIERLSGDLKLGGTLKGRITGGRMGDGKKYSWEADFDMKLPAKSAFGGQGCGS